MFTIARFTFQVAFWDALKTLDEGAARRAGSLARLMAHLVVKKQMSLTVLKVPSAIRGYGCCRAHFLIPATACPLDVRIRSLIRSWLAELIASVLACRRLF